MRKIDPEILNTEIIYSEPTYSTLRLHSGFTLQQMADFSEMSKGKIQSKLYMGAKYLSRFESYALQHAMRDQRKLVEIPQTILLDYIIPDGRPCVVPQVNSFASPDLCKQIEFVHTLVHWLFLYSHDPIAAQERTGKLAHILHQLEDSKIAVPQFVRSNRRAPLVRAVTVSTVSGSAIRFSSYMNDRSPDIRVVDALVRVDQDPQEVRKQTMDAMYLMAIHRSLSLAGGLPCYRRLLSNCIAYTEDGHKKHLEHMVRFVRSLMEDFHAIREEVERMTRPKEYKEAV